MTDDKCMSLVVVCIYAKMLGADPELIQMKRRLWSAGLNTNIPAQ